jgi:hypothetical protein
MQTTLGCLSRIVSRSLVSGVVGNGKEAPVAASASANAANADQTRLVTAVSGFPKQKTGYNIDAILKGQIGDDAYFVARHMDDWSSGGANSTVSDADLLNPAGATATTTTSTASTTRRYRVQSFRG